MPRKTLEERFWDRVVRQDGCWLWRGAHNRAGYARFYVGQTGTANGYVMAHRFAYELVVAAIPEGLTIDHLCRNTSCVNPDHLEAVTERENILRGAGPPAQNARKTHCKRGHEFTPDNIYTTPSKPGTRECRVCRRAAARDLYWRRKAAAERDG